MKDFNFENLSVYQKAIDFSNEIYLITKSWPREYLYDLTSQIRRASLSISLNIAEGSGRTKEDFKRFLSLARGSCYEIIPILEISFSQKLIDAKTKEKLYNSVITLSKMLSGLRNSLTR